MTILKKLLKRWETFLVLFLILEFVVFGAANPKFLRPASIMTAVVNYISVCIITLFVTMVMIGGGIDIQVASIIGLTSIIEGVLWSDAGFNIWAAVLCAVAAAALCGALSGFFVAYCGVQPMVVTLGGSFLYSGLALLVSGMSATPAYQGISGFPEKLKGNMQRSVDETIGRLSFTSGELMGQEVVIGMAGVGKVNAAMAKLLREYNETPGKTLDELLDFHVAFERIHPFQDGNGRVGRLILFKECLRCGIVPFIIDDRHKMFYYRGLKEWPKTPGYLRDTCLLMQDDFKASLQYFGIKW